MSDFVGAIDQGTTSSRFAVVDRSGAIVAMAQHEHTQHYPRPGWVEHDPAEIWEQTRLAVNDAIAEAGIGPADLAAVGVTNQRETTLAWDRAGTPLAPAVVWQDTRTAPLVSELAGDAGIDRFRAATGLPLATYFSGPKMRWLLDHVAGLEERAAAGDALMGTVDSWLAWNLVGRHVTDPSNASRTMLMDIATVAWSPAQAEAIGVPVASLADIVPSSGVIGECGPPLAGVPLAGVLGDQQAALFGQAAFTAGEAKNTYGTGCFLLLHTGSEPVPSQHGLLTTVAAQVGGEVTYALEGSVAIAGAAVQWLRDNLGIIDSAQEVETLARSVEDNGGVYFVPAFSGLFAPHWRPDARGVIAGLTRYVTAGHLARATLEATAFQTAEVSEAMAGDAGITPSLLKVDGGMVGNELLMQFQADLLDVPVVRPAVAETTVLGAAFAAGLAVGFWSGRDEIATTWREDRRWEPQMSEQDRRELRARWDEAVARTLGWLPSS